MSSKTKTILIIVACVFLFSSCSVLVEDHSSDGVGENTIEPTSFEDLHCFSLDAAQEAFFTDAERMDRIRLCRNFEAYEDGIYHDVYLLLETSSRLLKIILQDRGCFASSLYLCDVDGDGLDEVALQQTIGMSGGAGQYRSRIFKIKGERVEVLFDSTSFDTGYYSTFGDGFWLNVGNRWTCQTYPVKCSEKYADRYFDASGKVINDASSIVCDSFYSFTPVDVDKDGIFEISCKQYVSLLDHADYVGDAESVLKYNSIVKQFEVVQSAFSPMGQNSDDVNLSFLLDREYEAEKEQVRSNAEMTALNEEFEEKWKMKEEFYYGKLLDYYSSGSDKSMYDKTVAQQEEWSTYAAQQYDYYESLVHGCYTSGSIVPIKLSDYRRVLSRNRAIELYRQCADLCLNIEAP